jgi:hypothetical protein
MIISEESFIDNYILLAILYIIISLLVGVASIHVNLQGMMMAMNIKQVS